MSDQRLPPTRSPTDPLTLWLERVTAAVLVAVLLAVVWMVAVGWQPPEEIPGASLVAGGLGVPMVAATQPLFWLRLPTLEAEVLVMVGLFTLALVLVSVVALLHTRK
jgi:hypothetical protein